MIFNMAGGGNPLNFEVVGGATKPSGWSENTIWVNTDAAITGWVFSETKPESPTEGLVWFFVSTNSPVAFNALRGNNCMVYPAAVYQYISDAWVQKVATSYIDGAWRDWHTYLFAEGVLNEALTGYVWNYSSDMRTLDNDGEIEPGHNLTITTSNKIDLTDYNYVKAVYLSDNEDDGPYFRLLVDDESAFSDRVTTANLVAYKNSGSHMRGEMHELTLDISGLTGEYYLGYAWCNSSSADDTYYVHGHIYRWWLE